MQRVSKIFFFVSFVVMVMAAGCRRSDGASGKVGVTTSLPAVAYFVDRLLPDSIEVGAMIPAGSDHDTYSPQPSQLVRLTASRAYIALGPLEFETTWRDRIASSAPKMEWVDLSSHVEMIGEGEKADPHYWLSPRRCRQMVAGMKTELARVFPEAGEYIAAEAGKIDAELAEIDSMMTKGTEGREITFLTYHPSLSYVAADYGMEQLAIESEGMAVSANAVREVVDRAREKGVGTFFVQTGYDEARVGVIANETGGRIVKIDPEGAEPMQCMRQIVGALAGGEGEKD